MAVVATARHRASSNDVEPAQRPPKHRRLDIQGLRAVAVLVVIAFHAHLPIPGGFVGVDIFFVISGFVITEMLRRELAATGSIDLPRFYVRRFFRLFPALALVVTVTVVLSMLLLPPLGAQQNAAQTALGSLTLVANYVIAHTTGGYFDVAADLNPLLHTWSLAVEEQFYLFFPLVLFVTWRLGRRRRLARALPVIIILAIGVISFALAVSPPEVESPGSWLVGFYGPLARSWEFTVGVLLALAMARMPKPGTRGAVVLATLGTGLILTSLWLITPETIFPGYWTVLPVAGTALLLSAGANPSNVVSHTLAHRSLTWMGDRSYSWYLWHWPLIVAVRLLWPDSHWAPLGAALVSLMAAMASYRWVEQPLRTRRGSSQRATVRTMAAILLPPFAVSALSLGAAHEGFWNENVQNFNAGLTLVHEGSAAGCDTAVPHASRDEGECVWNPDAQGAPIYLVGDSTADHYSEAVIGAAETLGSRAVLSTTNACPLFNGYFFRSDKSDYWNTTCQGYQLNTPDFLRSAEPGVVVISQLGGYWAQYSAHAGVDETTASNDPDQKLELFTQRTSAMLVDLRAAGHEIIIVEPLPAFVGDYAYDPQTCSTLTIAAGRCSVSMPLTAAADQDPQGIADVLGEMAARTDSHILDLTGEICPEAVCLTSRDGILVYPDAGHLSVAASRLLVPTFTDALRPLVAHVDAPSLKSG